MFHKQHKLYHRVPSLPKINLPNGVICFCFPLGGGGEEDEKEGEEGRKLEKYQ